MEEPIFLSFSKQILNSYMENYMKAKREATHKGKIVCESTCCKHEAVMKPKLWTKLPKELVELVFSHLIARDNIALQLVSKEWKFAVSTNSYFQKLCQQVSNNKFAIMSWDDDKQNFIYHMFDYDSNKWRSSVCKKFTSMIDVSYKNATIVHDGGLVCFVPEHESFELPIVVYNPLTSVWKELPLQPLQAKNL